MGEEIANRADQRSERIQKQFETWKTIPDPSDKIVAFLNVEKEHSLRETVLYAIQQHMHTMADRLSNKEKTRIENGCRKAILKLVMDEWKKTPPSEEELRKFIMEMMNGHYGVAPSTYKELQRMINELQEGAEGEKIVLGPNLFSTYEFKTGRLHPKPPNPLGDCIKTNTTLKVGHPSPKTIERLERDRLYRLHHLDEVYERMLTDPAQQPTSKHFPETTHWYINQFAILSFETEMLEIARRNEIKLITTSRIVNQNQDTLKLDAKDRMTWAQDPFEVSVGGEVRIPRRRLAEEEVREVEPLILQLRKESGDPDWRTDRAFIKIDSMGATWVRNASNQPIALAETLGAPLVMNLTYNEGGNALVGKRDNGEPFVIIGKDSERLSKSLLTTDLGREVRDSEVRKAFAIDYGVRMENIHFVEQPGNFHLDMDMLLIEPNTILLNNAEESFEQLIWPDMKNALLRKGRSLSEIEYREEVKKDAVTLKKKFEDKTAQDLQEQGFNVIRVAGNGGFYRNLFNCVTATTPKGEKLMVMGDPGSRGRSALEKIKAQLPDVRIELLNEEKFSDLLHLDGGIHCSTQTIAKTCVET